MNSLFGHGIKQIQTIKKDLSTFESNYLEAPLSTQGQISVSISGLNRTINEISDLLQKETNAEQKQKCEKRLNKFRSELGEQRMRFEAIKKKREEAQYESSKSELLNRGARHSSAAGAGVAGGASSSVALSIGGGSSSLENPYAGGSSGMGYREGMYKEKASLGRSNQQLDEILEMGQRSFDDIVTQNEYLVRFEKKLSSSLMTLGVSRSTIQQVERRVYKDRFVFFGGAIVMLACFYFIYKYLK